MNYIGIDPGKAGGIAWISDSGKVAIVKLSNLTPTDVIGSLEEAKDTALNYKACAVIEKVASSPQMGVVSAFTFGKGYGILLAALAAARIPFVQVAPGVWQRTLGCLSKGDKNVTKAKAQQLYPGVKVTHANADALLLATYCRQKHAELF